MITSPPITLSIAGSDSSGGAGIQADIKTMTALGVYGVSVITAITAQNTKTIDSIYPIPPEIIEKQLAAVLEDIDIKVIKIGMLGNKENIEIVANTIHKHQVSHVVIDPVLSASCGTQLLTSDAITSLRTKLIPLATLLTPNLSEAGHLLGTEDPRNEKEMRNAVKSLNNLGCDAVLLKGGHLPGDLCEDLLFYKGKLTKYTHRRLQTKNTHGTGCTLSSAIAAELAKGHSIPDATKKAVTYVQKAIEGSIKWNVGHGNGPLNHFH